VGAVSAAVYRSGWPLHAMERRQLRETRNALQAKWVVKGVPGLYGGVGVPASLRQLLPPATRDFRHRIPLAPRPLGFLVDSALIGALLYGIRRVPALIIRELRDRRGVCVVCGYDAKGLGQCPECGAERLPQPSVRPPTAAPLAEGVGDCH
jgi:hypothetical protein